VDDWPAFVAILSDPAGDVRRDIKNNSAADLKTVRAFMDEDYLYVAIQIYDVFNFSLLRNYFIALDFDGDNKDEYHFGFRPNGETWVFNHTIDKNNWTAENTWMVVAAAKQDFIEIMISINEYRIPSNISLYSRVTDGVTNLDATEWLDVN
jgi:hypothetical protein